MAEQRRIAILEAYYGGSHAAFVDALRRYSRHDLTIATLPARKWKWRMRGASVWLTRDDSAWIHNANSQPVDVVLCSDMLSVADLRALLPAGRRDIPLVCYFHENQLTYPLPPGQVRDFQYGMTNITSCLAADAVWFNSRFHLEDFLEAAANLLRKMPDFVPGEAIAEIRRKTAVFPPPVMMERLKRPSGSAAQPLTILWCHRWEFDKNPEPFFDALLRLDREGLDFKLVLLGEQFRSAPPAFASAWDRLQSHITHAGYLPDRAEYVSMLCRCDVVVSTAIQENLGIAVIEAVLCGCQPLLPNRLAYPEVIPAEFHETCLYDSDSALFRRLRALASGRNRLDSGRLERLQETLLARFGVLEAVGRIDDALGELARSRCG